MITNCCNRESIKITGNFANIMPLGSSSFFAKVATNLIVTDLNNNIIPIINSDSNNNPFGNNQIVVYRNGLTISLNNNNDFVVSHMGNITLDTNTGSDINWSAYGGFVASSMGPCGGITLNKRVLSNTFAIMSTTGDLTTSGVSVTGSMSNLTLMANNIYANGNLSTTGGSDTAVLFADTSIAFNGGATLTSGQSIIKAFNGITGGPAASATVIRQTGLDCNCSSALLRVSDYKAPIISSANVEITNDIGSSTTNIIIISSCSIHVKEDTDSTNPRISGARVIFIAGKTIFIDGVATGTGDFLTATNGIIFSTMADMIITSLNGRAIRSAGEPIIATTRTDFSIQNDQTNLDVSSSSGNAGSISIMSGGNVVLSQSASASTLLLSASGNGQSAGNAGFLDIHAADNIYVYGRRTVETNNPWTINASTTSASRLGGVVHMDSGNNIIIATMEPSGSSYSIDVSAKSSGSSAGFIGMHADNKISIHTDIDLSGPGTNNGGLKLYALEAIHLIRNINQASTVELISAMYLLLDGTFNPTPAIFNTAVLSFAPMADCSNLWLYTCTTASDFEYSVDKGNWTAFISTGASDKVTLSSPASNIKVRNRKNPFFTKSLCPNCIYFSNSDSLRTCNTNLSTCSTNLGTCNTNYGTTSDSLRTCNTNLSTCSTNLGSCNTNYGTTSDSLRTCNTSLSTCSTNLGSCNTNYGTTSDSLRICNTNLSTCSTNLGTCNTNYGTTSDSLRTCNTNLSTCSTNLGSCNTNYGTTSDSLRTCNTSLSTCSTNLGSCNTNYGTTSDSLRTCQSDDIYWRNRYSSCNADYTATIDQLNTNADNLNVCSEQLDSCSYNLNFSSFMLILSTTMTTTIINPNILQVDKREAILVSDIDFTNYVLSNLHIWGFLR